MRVIYCKRGKPLGVEEQGEARGKRRETGIKAHWKEEEGQGQEKGAGRAERRQLGDGEEEVETECQGSKDKCQGREEGLRRRWWKHGSIDKQPAGDLFG